MLRTTDSPAELLRRVNQVLMNDPPMEDTFASLLLLRWEPERNIVTYANAGHCRPVLCSERGAEIITYSDIVLGLAHDSEFKDTTLQMKPGSALIAYTDGISEQVMKSGQQLGEEGVVEAVKQAYGTAGPVEQLMQNVLDDSAKPEFGDDILLFWLERSMSMERQTPRWFSPFRDVAEGN
jgi:serine phosphatase RsbU (regulator of sigma subunit)